MAVHGLKINDKAFQKLVDNILAKEIRKLKNAGEKAMKDISKSAIESFYKRANPHHDYTSIPFASRVRSSTIRQNRQYVWVDIDTYIDNSVYVDETSNYSVYRWADKRGIAPSWISVFVIGLQWNKGIVGLPDPFDHISSSPLKLIMKDEIERLWNRKVNKYFKL